MLRKGFPFLIVAVFGLALAGLSGCAKDDRISLRQLHELEAQAAQAEPVAVNPGDLPLTDLKPYRLGPGDVVSLKIVGLTGQYIENNLVCRVHGDGAITLPMVGKLPVAGLDLQGVERAVNEAYVPKFVKEELSVYADLGGPEMTTVLVTGAATNRGLITLRSNQRNLLYALGLAGGFNTGASGRVRVRSVRSDRPEQTYDLNDASGNGLRRILASAPLESGDTITIETAEPDQIYITGLVNSPRPLAIPSGAEFSLVRAIAAVGGTPDLIDPPEATVWRTLPDGKEVRVKLPLRDMLAGAAPDFKLKSGDILQVPHTWDTRVRDWIVQNIRVGPFTVGSRYDPLAQYNTNRALRRQDENRGNSFRDSVINELQRGVPNLILPQPTIQP